MDNINMKIELVKKALIYQKNSYSPYSNFKVGAALLTKNGLIYGGTNIESAAYSPTICAERTAFSKAVSEGERDFLAIAIVGGINGVNEEICSPCGVCRQFMKEFCDDSFLVIMAKSEGEFLEYTLGELLPVSFSVKNLG